MNNKTIGAMLLVIGTSIGGGMLALPVATAAGGFFKSTILLIGAWLFMTIGSLLVLEVTLWMPENANLSSMAKATLGRPGQAIAWISYALVLYCVLCAYTAGGSDLLHQFFAAMHINMPSGIDNTLYLVILGAIVWHGTRMVDYANRILMFVKLGALAILMMLIAPHTDASKLTSGKASSLISAVMVTATSFTFSIIVPSIRTYLKSNVKQLRIAIWIGSIIPLFCYIIWDYLVQSTISTYGANGLIHMAATGQVVGNLTTALSKIASNGWLGTFAHLFTSICMFTTFLAASLALSDFIADGIKVKKQGKNKWLIYGLTYLPILAILLFDPNIFIKGLSVAGTFCVVIVMIIPPAMAWSGRYIKNMATGDYEVFGGKATLLIEFILGIGLVLLSLLH